jgi:Spy/CpxP family protein refolding chaperone
MKLTATVLSMLALSAALALAQEPRPEGGRPPQPPGGAPRPPMGRDPMMEHLFPPHLLMQAGEEISLSEQQRLAIKEEMEKSREQFEAAQKNVREEIEALRKLLKPERVDEAQVAAQLDKVLAAESTVKKLHLSLLIHIKNQLTAEQQQKLRAFIKEHRPEGRPPGPPDRPEGRRRGGDEGDAPRRERPQRPPSE